MPYSTIAYLPLSLEKTDCNENNEVWRNQCRQA